MSDIQRVGVLGCGLMGSGIAQVAAAAGYETIVRDVAPADPRQGEGRHREVARQVRREGQAPGRRPRRDAAATLLHDRHGRPEALRHRRRGRHRGPGRQERALEGARRPVRRRDDLRLEHLEPHHRRDGRGDQARRPVRRAALLQSGAVDAAGGGGPDRHDVGGDLQAGLRVRPLARQGAGGGEGQLRLHREPAARALPARRDPRRWSTGWAA